LKRHPPQFTDYSGVSYPEKVLNFRCKFLLSGALYAIKLTPAKVQNTTHFHSRLHYVHPARDNTKNRTTGVPARITTRDRGTGKRDVAAKTGQVATHTSCWTQLFQ